MWISGIMIPFMISYIVGFGLLSGRPVFEDFLSGVIKGVRSVFEIFPTLLGLMAAVGVLRTSGFLSQAAEWLKLPAKFFHIPSEIIPIALIRMISNSAAVSLLLDLFSRCGPDSRLGMMASVMLSSTESVFYCISIYFGSVHITKTRYTIPGSLLATIAGIAAAVILCQNF